MGEEIRIGEKMSGLVDIGKVVTSERGDCYEDVIAFYQHRPLDTGRLLYVKLMQAAGAQSDFDIEVYWNHFTNAITVVIAGRQSEYEAVFKDMQMARTDKLDYIRDFVQRIERTVPFHSEPTSQ